MVRKNNIYMKGLVYWCQTIHKKILQLEKKVGNNACMYVTNFLVRKTCVLGRPFANNMVSKTQE